MGWSETTGDHIAVAAGHKPTAPGYAHWWAFSLVLPLLLVLPGFAGAQTENLLDRISNERMRGFEERLTANINAALNRYVSHSQYVLSVKVIWNRDLIPAVSAPGLSPGRQKLPGFPIFVAPPGASTGDDSTPPFVRMVVKVLLDETLPEYYERFIRKIVPIVARFDSSRGDQVLVLKETFPVRKEEDFPPTLPGKELLQQLGAAPEGQPLPAQAVAAQGPLPPGARAPKTIPGLPRPRGPLPGRQGYTPSSPAPMEAAQIAYEEGRYTDALRIAQAAFQTATSNQERALYLGMEGSIMYTLENEPAARASWRRALVFDPTNLDIQRVLHFLDTRVQSQPLEQGGETGRSEESQESQEPRLPERPGGQQ